MLPGVVKKLASRVAANYEVLMRADDIRKVHQAVPFRPFSLVLAGRRAFRVPHHDFLSIAPKGTALCLWAQDGGVGSYLDPMLVAEIRMDANGAKRSKRRRG